MPHSTFKRNCCVIYCKSKHFFWLKGRLAVNLHRFDKAGPHSASPAVFFEATHCRGRLDLTAGRSGV